MRVRSRPGRPVDRICRDEVAAALAVDRRSVAVAVVGDAAEQDQDVVEDRIAPARGDAGDAVRHAGDVAGQMGAPARR